MKIIRRVYDWMGSKVNTPYAKVWLCALFFIESSFFVIPVDPLLILYCVEDRKKSLYFAALATVSSVLGGIFGYCIGMFLWESLGTTLVNWFISQETFHNVVTKYKLYQHWAVLLGGFTPIPYKAVTISAGFCKLPILPFIFYSFIARGARFYLVAGAIYAWGEKIKKFIDDYFNYLVIAFTLIVILSLKALAGSR